MTGLPGARVVCGREEPGIMDARAGCFRHGLPVALNADRICRWAESKIWQLITYARIAL